MLLPELDNARVSAESRLAAVSKLSLVLVEFS
jgi:hypothetical protein